MTDHAGPSSDGTSVTRALICCTRSPCNPVLAPKERFWHMYTLNKDREIKYGSMPRVSWSRFRAVPVPVPASMPRVSWSRFSAVPVPASMPRVSWSRLRAVPVPASMPRVYWRRLRVVPVPATMPRVSWSRLRPAPFLLTNNNFK